MALAIALAVGWQLWNSYSQSRIVYETQPLDFGTVQAGITATGALNPVVSVQVGSQVSGNIKALYADFNTKVQQGQLVALIDPQIFQSQVDQATGAASSMHSAVVSAQAQVVKARADVSGAKAGKSNMMAVLAKDRANAVNAQIQWQRSDDLFKQGIVSKQDHDSARAGYDAAQAQLTADQAQIDASDNNIQAVEAQVQVALTQLSAAQAQERQSQAALRQTNISLEHTKILAPVSGTVIARYMDVGQTVAASFQAPTIFNIAQDLTKMQVDTSVDESDIGTVRTGQAATFTVDAYPGTTFRGSVTDVRKAPITAQNVVTYDVVIAVSNPDLKLFPGMTANVAILTARQENALKVPNAALRFRPSSDMLKQAGLSSPKPGQQQLYVMTGGKTQAVPVSLGISDGRFTVVTAPSLKKGDQVVVRAQAK
ncbi:MAG: efflux RND transporter periplasmic adaptor subunit, partial [Terriglobales bacterium]